MGALPWTRPPWRPCAAAPDGGGRAWAGTRARTAARRGAAAAFFVAASWAACVPVGSEEAAAPFPVPSNYPPVAAGSYSPADHASAERLLAAARESLAARRYGAAAAAAGEILDRHAAVPGSSEALWVVAFAARAEGRHAEAAEAAGGLSALLGEEHPAFAEVQAFHAEVLFDAGRHRDAAAATLRLPEQAYTAEAAARAAASVARLGRDDLERLAAAAPAGSAAERWAPVFAELALAAAYAADAEAARAHAQLARRAGASGRASRIAAAVLDGDVSALDEAAPVIGVVLPITGSPANRAYAESFLEGVEVASAWARRAGVPVQVAIEDNRGTVRGSARSARALATRGADAILGPLRDENVSEAARAKPGRVPLFSPTARRVPAADGAYSLGAASPLAARTLAEALADLGYAAAVLLHGSGHGEALEAHAFASAFEDAGGSVEARVEYPSGATTFLDPLEEVALLAPELLVVLSSPADLELLAPQMSFAGLDTLGIQVAGAFAWTSAEVTSSVAHRHTDRVIAVSPASPAGPGVPDDPVPDDPAAENAAPGDPAPADPAAEFRAAYESRFRKTLQSDVPAVAFDLFRIALAAYGEGRTRPGGTAAAAGSLRRFRGVTGTFSVVDGRLEREAFLVRIFRGELLPVGADLPPAREPGGSPRPGGEPPR